MDYGKKYEGRPVIRLEILITGYFNIRSICSYYTIHADSNLTGSPTSPHKSLFMSLDLDVDCPICLDQLPFTAIAALSCRAVDIGCTRLAVKTSTTAVPLRASSTTARSAVLLASVSTHQK